MSPSSIDKQDTIILFNQNQRLATVASGGMIHLEPLREGTVVAIMSGVATYNFMGLEEDPVTEDLVIDLNKFTDRVHPDPKWLVDEHGHGIDRILVSASINSLSIEESGGVAVNSVKGIGVVVPGQRAQFIRITCQLAAWGDGSFFTIARNMRLCYHCTAFGRVLRLP